MTEYSINTIVLNRGLIICIAFQRKNMKRVCAWCNKMMSPAKSGKSETELVTHSICSDCADNLDFQLGVSLRRYLDGLKVPIIALDRSGQVIAVNAAAARLSGKAAGKLPVEWQDKIYECAHARLPLGCKTTVHCSGCAIRIATTNTFNTGISTRDLPAHLNHCSSDENEKIELLISTDKIDNLVFLRIVRL